MANKIQDLTLRLVKEKHLDMKTITDSKAHTLEYTRVIGDELLSINASDGFEKVVQVLESLTTKLNS